MLLLARDAEVLGEPGRAAADSSGLVQVEQHPRYTREARTHLWPWATTARSASGSNSYNAVSER